MARALLRDQLPSDEVSTASDRRSLEAMGPADVVIPLMFRVDGALMDAVKPRLIQQWGSGLDGIDLIAAKTRQIAVARVPASGSNAESVAEHALLLMLALLRQFPAALEGVRRGVLGAPMGRMLAGSTVGLWGLGDTAFALARRLRALDVRLVGITRDPTAAKIADFNLDACVATGDRATCLRDLDFLVLCVRLSPETRGLVDRDTIGLLPKRAFIVNTSRGALIDYSALQSALIERRIAGAALDVYWAEPIDPNDPLVALPSVIATPHVAGVTEQSYAEIARAVASNVEHLRRGEPVEHAV